MPNNYHVQFAKLNVNRNSKHWTAVTGFAAPHKPFLLMSVMDLMAQNIIRANFIKIDDVLDTFNLYWEQLVPDKKSSIVYPFYHLHNDGFWHLVPVAGKAQVVREGGDISSMSKMRELVLGARFDDELFGLLQIEKTRHELRQILIETYFLSTSHPILMRIAKK